MLRSPPPLKNRDNLLPRSRLTDVAFLEPTAKHFMRAASIILIIKYKTENTQKLFPKTREVLSVSSEFYMAGERPA